MARRKSSGSGAGAVLLVIGALVLWLVSQYGQILLILGILGLIGWALYAWFGNRPLSAPAATNNTSVEQAEEQDIPAKAGLGESDGDSAWIPATGNAEVQGRRIGGMLYVGKRLAAASGGTEPALINPALPVGRGPVDLSLRRTDYWPSYATITEDTRNAYLQWLSTGRKDSTADLGYVFLYFYGLERRALFDAEGSSAAKAELPAIEAEIERLLKVYGHSGSMQRYGGSLLDLLRARNDSSRLFASSPPPLRYGRWTFMHRLALAQCAASGEPLPASWAFQWFRADPTTKLRTAARRCPREFETLFKERYAKAFGAGMVLPKNRTQLQLEYVPASRGLSHARQFALKFDLPDVTVLTSPVKKLQDIAEGCYAALANYSRAVGTDGSGADSLEALAELPFALWPEEYRLTLQRMHDVATQAGKPAPVPLTKVLSWLPPVGELTRSKAKMLYRALGQAGLAMEPDTRLGAPMPSAESIMYLFAATESASPKTSARYSAAALTLQLAVAVAAADGETTESERSLLVRQLEVWLHLDDSERQRLRALLCHLTTQPPKLTGLKKPIESLDAKAREVIGDFLLLVAQADAKVTAAEVKTLEKLFRLLGLDVKLVYSKVHVAATEPVTVRPAAVATTGYEIPQPPKPEKPARRVVLDPAKVAALQADSERVSAILGAIFNADTEEPEPVPVAELDSPASKEPAVMGLDDEHSAFVRTLLTRMHWSRTELEELAADRGTMIDGTLERINEAAFDIFDRPFLEGDDPIELNQEIVQELIK